MINNVLNLKTEHTSPTLQVDSLPLSHQGSPVERNIFGGGERDSGVPGSVVVAHGLSCPMWNLPEPGIKP
ncbi:unnamed protein product, partial [Rangifer tarandus platyrhynchus]